MTDTLVLCLCVVGIFPQLVSPMKTLYFIRHGTSQHNVLFKNFGSKIFFDTRYYDTKLTGEGHEQSLSLGKTWDKKNIQFLIIYVISFSYSSSSSRQIGQ